MSFVVCDVSQPILSYSKAQDSQIVAHLGTDRCHLELPIGELIQIFRESQHYDVYPDDFADSKEEPLVIFNVYQEEPSSIISPTFTMRKTQGGNTD